MQVASSASAGCFTSECTLHHQRVHVASPASARCITSKYTLHHQQVHSAAPGPAHQDRCGF
ncbi:MAG: hypothetical protein FJY39_01305 [Betaproteobacteria bacterium]|nr:hypothetical protein [Betaproteobacteria bacterium]